MKRTILVAMLPVFLAGCHGGTAPQDTVVKINKYTISRAEFEREFKDSRFGRDDTPQSRKEFLGNLIDRVLILQDAQRNGLDNDPQFLKMVEKFWEQSLLRLALEKKTKEIAGGSSVSDKAIEETYQQMLKEGKTAKPYEEAYQQIKWEMTRLKESRMMSDWLALLHKNAYIRIRKGLAAEDK